MSDEIKKVCVTGGAGFIGSYVVRKLLDRGMQVLVVDNLSVGLRENVSDSAELLEKDILDADLAGPISDCDAVIHMAARVAIRSSFEFVVEDANTNVVGTANILRCALTPGSRVKKVVAASSMAVYADSAEPVPIDEDYPLKPVSPYGVSKQATEMLVQQMCDNAGVDSAVLRLFNTYGSGQALSPYVGVVTIFANAMRAGETPRIFGDGQQQRDFVHVDDVSSAFVNALVHRTGGEIFNIGTGRGLTVSEVYREVARVLAFEPPPIHVDAVPGELRNSIAAIQKAGEMISYRPEHSFSSSIAEILNRI